MQGRKNAQVNDGCTNLKRKKVQVVIENVTVKMIVEQCKHILRDYDKKCANTTISDEAKGRRDRFEVLITAFPLCTPRDAIIQLYDFYINEKSPCSRLAKLIENGLYDLTGIRYKVNGNVGLFKAALTFVSAPRKLDKMISDLRRQRDAYQKIPYQRKGINIE